MDISIRVTLYRVISKYTNTSCTSFTRNTVSIEVLNLHAVVLSLSNKSVAILQESSSSISPLVSWSVCQKYERLSRFLSVSKRQEQYVT